MSPQWLDAVTAQPGTSPRIRCYRWATRVLTLCVLCGGLLSAVALALSLFAFSGSATWGGTTWSIVVNPPPRRPFSINIDLNTPPTPRQVRFRLEECRYSVTVGWTAHADAPRDALTVINLWGRVSVREYRYALSPIEVGRSLVVSVSLSVLIAAVCMATGVTFIVFGSRWYRHRSRGCVLACNKCSYDLTGNASGRCPECGTPVPGRSAGATVA